MNSKIVDEFKLFLDALDKKTDSSLLERHVDMYLLGVLSVISKAAADGLISYENYANLKASVTQEVSNFKREVKDDE